MDNLENEKNSGNIFKDLELENPDELLEQSRNDFQKSIDTSKQNKYNNIKR